MWHYDIIFIVLRDIFFTLCDLKKFQVWGSVTILDSDWSKHVMWLFG